MVEAGDLPRLHLLLSRMDELRDDGDSMKRMRAQFLVHTRDGSYRLEQEDFAQFLVQAGGRRGG